MDRSEILELLQKLYTLLEDSTDQQQCFEAWELVESALKKLNDEEQ